MRVTLPGVLAECIWCKAETQQQQRVRSRGLALRGRFLMFCLFRTQEELQKFAYCLHHVFARLWRNVTTWPFAHRFALVSNNILCCDAVESAQLSVVKCVCVSVRYLTTLSVAELSVMDEGKYGVLLEWHWQGKSKWQAVNPCQWPWRLLQSEVFMSGWSGWIGVKYVQQLCSLQLSAVWMIQNKTSCVVEFVWSIRRGSPVSVWAIETEQLRRNWARMPGNKRHVSGRSEDGGNRQCSMGPRGEKYNALFVGVLYKLKKEQRVWRPGPSACDLVSGTKPLATFLWNSV
jgi:hypothetical protein